MTGQDEREVLAGVVERHQLLRGNDGRPQCGCGFLLESSLPTWRTHPEHVTDAILAAGFHLSTTAEVKAEELEGVVRRAMEVRAGGLVPNGGSTWGEPDGYWITMHAPIVAEAIATHLRETGGA